jgi:hypothetical protein
LPFLQAGRRKWRKFPREILQERGRPLSSRKFLSTQHNLRSLPREIKLGSIKRKRPFRRGQAGVVLLYSHNNPRPQAPPLLPLLPLSQTLLRLSVVKSGDI